MQIYASELFVASCKVVCAAIVRKPATPIRLNSGVPLLFLARCSTN